LFHVVGQCFDGIAVKGVVELDIPAKSTVQAGQNYAGHLKLNSCVLDISGIDFSVAVSTHGIHGQVNQLPGGVGFVPGKIKTQTVVKEACF